MVMTGLNGRRRTIEKLTQPINENKSSLIGETSEIQALQRYYMYSSTSCTWIGKGSEEKKEWLPIV